MAQWLRCCATNRKVAGSIPAGVTGFFIDIKSFQLHYGPGVNSASNRIEYREYFLGVKSGRCIRLTTYHHPVPLSQNLGALTSWNPLGLSKAVMGLLFTLLPLVSQHARGLFLTTMGSSYEVFTQVFYKNNATGGLVVSDTRHLKAFVQEFDPSNCIPNRKHAPH